MSTLCLSITGYRLRSGDGIFAGMPCRSAPIAR